VKARLTVDFARFDTRKYRTLPVREGYREWVHTYEATVLDEMDVRLLARLTSLAWPGVGPAVDLACGTGRIGAWLKRSGVSTIDGVDMTAEMMEVAREKGIYRRLVLADVSHTGLRAGAYDLAIQVLADEHLRDLRPLYAEAARITSADGAFVIVGYHPHFLLRGIPTHFDSRSGEPVAIESHVHLFSDHVKAARAAGWVLLELEEGTVDDEWLRKKPKWEKYRDWPVSFAMAWRKGREAGCPPSFSSSC
jgi:SAM-dependent methyltransferase